MKSPSFVILFLTLSLLSCDNNTKEMEPPEIFLNMPIDGYEVEPDSTFIISPKITYDYDSEYLWKLNGEVMDYNERELKYHSTTFKSDTLQFFVYTPAGSDSIIIPVHTIVWIDFEEFNLDKYKTHINSSETGYFNSKGVLLPVINIPEQSYWSGFSISIETNTIDQTVDNQFSVFSSSGADKSKHFSVFFADEQGNSNRLSFSDGENHTLKSIAVNNSTYTALTIKRGDEDSRAFDFGDWYLLTIKGYDKDNNYTGEIEFYLADYRFENSNKRYVVSTWNNIYLQGLGKINSVEFILTSSDVGYGGFNTPLYFCLDNLKILD